MKARTDPAPELQPLVMASSACGENLEYAPEFVALQQAAIGRDEQQFGTAIIPAEAPDWHRLEQDAQALLQRSRDIRLMSLLTRAWTENQGLPGYARGLQLLAQTLQQHWADVHPGLHIGDEYDPMQRVNAIAAFADPMALGRSLRRAVLLSGPAGQLSVREAVAILESGDGPAPASYPGGSARLRVELGQALPENAAALNAIETILQSLSAIRQVLEAELEPAWIPSFKAIEQPLATLSAAISVRRGLHEISGQAREPAPEPAAAAGPVVLAPTPGLSRRDQALQSLQQVCEFLEASEPSHPAPILIRRALRLLQMNFYEIVRELLPEGLAQVDALAGIRPADGTRDG